MLVGGQKLLSMICPEMKYIIPLFCSSLFINETIRLQEVSSKYKDDKNKIQIIYDFIEFLKKNELDQYDMPNEFCSINLDLISPHIISNSIIELCKDNLVYIKNIAEELSRLLCETVSLIYYKDSDLETIINSARHFLDLSFRNIEICIEYDMLFDERSIEKLIKEIPLCSRIIITKSYFKKMVNFHNKIPIIYTTSDIICQIGEKINDFSKFAFATLQMYIESLKYNNCLYKKVSIDKFGNIKNCLLSNESFGNIKDSKIGDVVLSAEFQKYWNINKDQIEGCSDCELRYACLDCRFSKSIFLNTNKPQCSYK